MERSRGSSPNRRGARLLAAVLIVVLAVPQAPLVRASSLDDLYPKLCNDSTDGASQVAPHCTAAKGSLETARVQSSLVPIWGAVAAICFTECFAQITQSGALCMASMLGASGYEAFKTNNAMALMGAAGFVAGAHAIDGLMGAGQLMLQPASQVVEQTRLNPAPVRPAQALRTPLLNLPRAPDQLLSIREHNERIRQRMHALSARDIDPTSEYESIARQVESPEHHIRALNAREIGILLESGHIGEGAYFGQKGSAHVGHDGNFVFVRCRNCDKYFEPAPTGSGVVIKPGVKIAISDLEFVVPEVKGVPLEPLRARILPSAQAQGQTPERTPSAAERAAALEGLPLLDLDDEPTAGKPTTDLPLITDSDGGPLPPRKGAQVSASARGSAETDGQRGQTTPTETGLKTGELDARGLQQWMQATERLDGLKKSRFLEVRPGDRPATASESKRARRIFEFARAKSAEQLEKQGLTPEARRRIQNQLIAAASDQLKAQGVRHSVSRDASGELKIEVSPKGDHPLNRHAAAMVRNQKASVVYSMEPMEGKFGAQFSPERKSKNWAGSVHIPEGVILSGNPADFIQAHEVAHVKTARGVQQGRAGVFYGDAIVTSGDVRLSKSETYESYLSFDEADTYPKEARAAAQRMRRALDTGDLELFRQARAELKHAHSGGREPVRGALELAESMRGVVKRAERSGRMDGGTARVGKSARSFIDSRYSTQLSFETTPQGTVAVFDYSGKSLLGRRNGRAIKQRVPLVGSTGADDPKNLELLRTQVDALHDGLKVSSDLLAAVEKSPLIGDPASSLTVKSVADMAPLRGAVDQLQATSRAAFRRIDDIQMRVARRGGGSLKTPGILRPAATQATALPIRERIQNRLERVNRALGGKPVTMQIVYDQGSAPKVRIMGEGPKGRPIEIARMDYRVDPATGELVVERYKIWDKSHRGKGLEALMNDRAIYEIEMTRSSKPARPAPPEPDRLGRHARILSPEEAAMARREAGIPEPESRPRPLQPDAPVIVQQPEPKLVIDTPALQPESHRLERHARIIPPDEAAAVRREAGISEPVSRQKPMPIDAPAIVQQAQPKVMVQAPPPQQQPEARQLRGETRPQAVVQPQGLLPETAAIPRDQSPARFAVQGGSERVGGLPEAPQRGPATLTTPAQTQAPPAAPRPPSQVDASGAARGGSGQPLTRPQPIALQSGGGEGPRLLPPAPDLSRLPPAPDRLRLPPGPPAPPAVDPMAALAEQSRLLSEMQRQISVTRTPEQTGRVTPPAPEQPRPPTIDPGRTNAGGPVTPQSAATLHGPDGRVIGLVPQGGQNAGHVLPLPGAGGGGQPPGTAIVRSPVDGTPVVNSGGAGGPPPPGNAIVRSPGGGTPNTGGGTPPPGNAIVRSPGGGTPNTGGGTPPPGTAIVRSPGGGTPNTGGSTPPPGTAIVRSPGGGTPNTGDGTPNTGGGTPNTGGGTALTPPSMLSRAGMTQSIAANLGIGGQQTGGLGRGAAAAVQLSGAAACATRAATGQAGGMETSECVGTTFAGGLAIGVGIDLAAAGAQRGADALLAQGGRAAIAGSVANSGVRISSAAMQSLDPRRLGGGAFVAGSAAAAVITNLPPEYQWVGARLNDNIGTYRESLTNRRTALDNAERRILERTFRTPEDIEKARRDFARIQEQRLETYREYRTNVGTAVDGYYTEMPCGIQRGQSRTGTGGVGRRAVTAGCNVVSDGLSLLNKVPLIGSITGDVDGMADRMNEFGVDVRQRESRIANQLINEARGHGTEVLAEFDRAEARVRRLQREARDQATAPSASPSPTPDGTPPTDPSATSLPPASRAGAEEMIPPPPDLPEIDVGNIEIPLIEPSPLAPVMTPEQLQADARAELARTGCQGSITECMERSRIESERTSTEEFVARGIDPEADPEGAQFMSNARESCQSAKSQAPGADGSDAYSTCLINARRELHERRNPAATPEAGASPSPDDAEAGGDRKKPNWAACAMGAYAAMQAISKHLGAKKSRRTAKESLSTAEKLKDKPGESNSPIAGGGGSGGGPADPIDAALGATSASGARAQATTQAMRTGTTSCPGVTSEGRGEIEAVLGCAERHDPELSRLGGPVQLASTYQGGLQLPFDTFAQAASVDPSQAIVESLRATGHVPQDVMNNLAMTMAAVSNDIEKNGLPAGIAAPSKAARDFASVQPKISSQPLSHHTPGASGSLLPPLQPRRRNPSGRALPAYDPTLDRNESLFMRAQNIYRTWTQKVLLGQGRASPL